MQRIIKTLILLHVRKMREKKSAKISIFQKHVLFNMFLCA